MVVRDISCETVICLSCKRMVNEVNNDGCLSLASVWSEIRADQPSAAWKWRDLLPTDWKSMIGLIKTCLSDMHQWMSSSSAYGWPAHMVDHCDTHCLLRKDLGDPCHAVLSGTLGTVATHCLIQASENYWRAEAAKLHNSIFLPNKTKVITPILSETDEEERNRADSDGTFARPRPVSVSIRLFIPHHCH